MKNYVVFTHLKTDGSPEAEAVEASSFTITERSLSFKDRDGQVIRQFNNHGGWLSWAIFDEAN